MENSKPDDLTDMASRRRNGCSRGFSARSASRRWGSTRSGGWLAPAVGQRLGLVWSLARGRCDRGQSRPWPARRKAVMAIWCVCICGTQWRASGLLCDMPFDTFYGLFARWTRLGALAPAARSAAPHLAARPRGCSGTVIVDSRFGITSRRLLGGAMDGSFRPTSAEWLNALAKNEDAACFKTEDWEKSFFTQGGTAAPGRLLTRNG